jgi:serine/threonine protein phosphatase PrpC
MNSSLMPRWIRRTIRATGNAVNNYRSFSATVIGISHTKHDKACQDFALHYADKGMTLAVVADGHGSDDCFRSAKGAEFAAECAKEGIIAFVNRPGPGLFALLERKSTPTRKSNEELIGDLVKHIIAEWHGKVKDDYESHPFTQEELESAGEKYQEKYAEGSGLHHAYGATLIAAVITADYWFGIHIGDGRLTALYKDGSYNQPVPWDERCFLNVTTSICDEDAAETARVYYCPRTERDLPLAVFLCSDGIDDNYPVDDNDKHLFKLYRTISQTFAEDGFDSTCAQIQDLAHSFATKGKGDDTSIAGIIDMDAVKATAGIWKGQIEGEEAQNTNTLPEAGVKMDREV